MHRIHFLQSNGDFYLESPENTSYLYFPLASEKGLKSAVTPNLGGDAKLDQEHFLLEPVSADNLHNNRSTRNFWVRVNGKAVWSVTGASAEAENARFTEAQEKSSLTAGLMWQRLKRTSDKLGLTADVTSFIPVDDNVEIMLVQLTNTGDKALSLQAFSAIPIFGRSADNIRDHRHVTSMLHRIRTTNNAVIVKPTMSFDERGHRLNEMSYYVAGTCEDGASEAFYPTVESFIGEGGTFTHPQAVYREGKAVDAGTELRGKEAMGAIRFSTIELKPGSTTTYCVLAGVADKDEAIEKALHRFGTVREAEQALEATRQHWQDAVNVSYHTGDPDFDNWMRWVSFQPYLRRLFGCSFLPHHDYGRGGRGWRDLWQDCLSLLIMDPREVRQMIVDNFGGVRIDGTNATIIGNGQGEFIADRNGIARVWMDHAFWPYMTTQFYIDQTGDTGVLMERAAYFKDAQTKRGTAIDDVWKAEDGLQLRTDGGRIYFGTLLEHLLVENLTAFYEVGEHNILRLRGADWNDALDMAGENGESVAFTAAYAGNLHQLAELLELIREKHHHTTVEVAAELEILLCEDPTIYYNVDAKRARLDTYLSTCSSRISGRTVQLPIDVLISDLNGKAEWLYRHLRGQEWIQTEENGWFNSYYDNNGRRVEGFFPSGLRMMLTGQVFAIMSGTASEDQIRAICESADRYLYDRPVGGYRLNTDFHEVKMDMGRMFGFAYGEKENGAVFSHMTVMYANALYRRGFAKEGYKALQTLFATAMDFDTSRIYPGIPEYFTPDGRGVYHYLTGAASWYMMTVITQAFGVRGENGNLIIEPQLQAEQFDENGVASLTLPFAGKKVSVQIENLDRLEAGDYEVAKASTDGKELVLDGVKAILARDAIEREETEHIVIRVQLQQRKEKQ